jgi:hypothetical protein
MSDANRAKEIQTNPVFKEAIQRVKEELIQAAANCAAKEDLERYRYMVALKVVDKVVSHINAVANTDTEQPSDVATLYETESRKRLSLFGLKVA